jgi:hypothetical protein
VTPTLLDRYDARSTCPRKKDALTTHTRRISRLVLLPIGLILVCLSLGKDRPPFIFAQGETHNIIRVATTGTDAPECGSGTSPCQTIQYAVNLTESGDVILVAEGTYTYSGSTPHSSCSASSTHPPVVCVQNKHLTLLGGYRTGGWSTADPVANPTFIDGGNWYRGVTVVGSSTLEAQASLRMEGFTIQHAMAQGATGGADYQTSGYGGGIFAYRAPVVLRELIFSSNRAIGGSTAQAYGGAGVGGGLAIDSAPDGTTCTLENLTFDGNEARGGSGQDRGGTALGGGMFTYDAVVSASHITLANNTAAAGSSSGSGWANGLTADALGGGAAIHTLSNATLQYVTATGNQALGGNAGTQGADDRAGAAHGGALYAERATLTVLDSDLRHNMVRSGDATNSYVGGGGGIMAGETNLTVERTLIISNTAKGGNGTTTGANGSAGGGGMYLARFTSDATALVLNSVIADNYVEQGTVGSISGGGGGGLWLQGVQIDLIHTTIAHNRLGRRLYGQAGIFVDFGARTPTVANISYSIISDHTSPASNAAALHAWEGNTVNLYRGILANNYKDTNADGYPPPGPGGTFSGVGTMLSPASAGFASPGSPHYNYHILASSAAEDEATGSTTTLDMDRNSRPYNGASDIGADEYAPFALHVSPRDGSLLLDWREGATVWAGVVDHYEVLVTCEQGASPPDQGGCGSPIHAGELTRFVLTGLTNFKPYTVTINVRDPSHSLIASSTTMTASPTNIFVYLPGISRDLASPFS